MTDLVFGPVYNWWRSLWSSMADLADKIDDLICIFEGSGGDTMDTLAMLAFGWLIVLLFVLAVAKYVYARFIKKVSVPEAKTDVVPVKSAEAPAAVSDVKVEKAAVSVAKPVVRTGGAGGGGRATPTPPLRKRLTVGKGSRQESRAGLSTITPPTATGPNAEAVRWVNSLLSWIYTDSNALGEIVSVWIQTLNDLAKKSVEEHGVGVEVIRLLPETHPPTISNIFVECAPNDDITITCDCDATPALQVKALRQKGEKVQVSHYRLNVNRFRARLTAVCIPEKMLADLKCDGWPEIKVALAPVGTIKSNLDEQSLQEVISDILMTSMRAAHVHINLGQFVTCPRFSRNNPAPAHVLPVHYDSLSEEMAAKSRIHPIPPDDQKLGDKRLLVKVLHARGLAPGTQDPYCIIEMDEPPQKNQTCVKKDTDSPLWDEHFLFEVSSGTCEILLEVHDRATKRFLGLGIVGMEELLINPNQRQTITLQPRPYETENVAGTLTVEFMFIEGTEVPVTQGKPYKLKETLRSVTPSGNVLTTTKTVFSAPSSQNVGNGGGNVADSALRELQYRNSQSPSTNNNPASKTTLIIHSVQRQASVRGDPSRVKVTKTNDGSWHEVDPVQPGANPTELQSEEAPVQTTATDERGRSRRRKRDFFGTIKRRLEMSRNRSKSVGPDEGMSDGEELTRSVSADRVRDASAHSTGGFVVPSLRITDGEMSRRSSISDLSGVSGASTRTYIHEASTLVLETNENGINKHYLIPLSMAQKSKWRKRGTKLHIFNDHTFIAKHMPAKTTCQICATMIPRRFGKQAYECRDCLIKCHKACHVKADHTCPQSTIQSIELTKMTSPLLDKKLLPPVSPRINKSPRPS